MSSAIPQGPPMSIPNETVYQIIPSFLVNIICPSLVITVLLTEVQSLSLPMGIKMFLLVPLPSCPLVL